MNSRRCMISSWFELTRQQRLEGSTLPTGGSGLSLRFDDLNPSGTLYYTKNFRQLVVAITCASVCTFWVGGGEGRKVAPDENRPQPAGRWARNRYDGRRRDHSYWPRNSGASKKSGALRSLWRTDRGRHRLAASHLSR